MKTKQIFAFIFFFITVGVSFAQTNNYSAPASAGTGGTGNTNLGVNSGSNSTNSFNNANVNVGVLTGSNNVAGNENTMVGYSAFTSNNSGVGNTGVGIYTLFKNTTGSYNVALGKGTLSENLSGTDNVSVGLAALGKNTTGNNNQAVGKWALLFNTGGSNNSAFGGGAGYNNLTGNLNSFFGQSAGFDSLGNNNTFLGANAGKNLITGNYNTFIGASNLPTTAATALLAGNNTSNTIILADGNYNQRLYIHSNGNTGIGLGNNVIPQNTLEVKNPNSGFSGLRLTNLPNTTASITNTTNKVLSVNTTGDVILVDDKQGAGGPTTHTLTSATNTMTSTVNGVVATAPIVNAVTNTIASGQLTTTINGVASTAVTLPVPAPDTSIYNISANITPVNFGDRVVSLNNNNLVFNTTGTNAARNRVYIGATPVYPTTTGDYRLYVEGGILTQKVKVALRSSANWADYVFANNYKLMSLNEVEAFIKLNKHLPGVASAESIAKEGLDVSEMQAKQMEKIEELTLYAIEQNKRIEKQDKEIEELKVLVNTLVNKNK